MTNALVLVLSVLAVVVAAGLLAHAVSCRRGRTPERREWAFGSEETARTTILMLPGGAAMLAAIGFLGLTRLTDAVAPLVALFLVVGVVPVLWAGLRLPLPLALYPAWAREQRARVRSRQKASQKAGKGKT